MRIGTAEMLSKVDAHCIEQLGIPGILLMENAALKVLKHLDTESYDSYTIICGSGNNGGDGFAVARQLKSLGKTIEVFMVGGGSLSADCRINHDILKAMGVPVESIANVEDLDRFRDAIRSSQVVVDAIFGTGIKRALSEPYLSVVEIVNENSRYTVAVDIPSGMMGSTGEIMGACIRADKTVTFQLYKRGFLNYSSQRYTGQVIVEPIGVPEEIIELYFQKEFITEREEIKSLIPKREVHSHKGNHGRLLIIAGSRGFTGAAYIAAEAAVKSGAGLVTLACYKKIEKILAAKLVEAMTLAYESKEDLESQIIKANAIAVGPGIGNSQNSLEILKLVLEKAEAPVVIDADGLNVLAAHLEILKDKRVPVIITPHVGEMARLTGYSVEYINSNRLQVAKDFAEKYSIIVLLKGYNTVITDGEYTYINPTGSSVMASGGMGDCLTGIVTSLIAQGIEPLRATQLSAYVHGYAADMLGQELYSVTASEVIAVLPRVLKQLQTL